MTATHPDDAPLSEDEFNELARTGHLVLSIDRDNIAIHNYLRYERGWTNVRTFKDPVGDDPRIEITAIFD